MNKHSCFIFRIFLGSGVCCFTAFFSGVWVFFKPHALTTLHNGNHQVLKHFSRRTNKFAMGFKKSFVLFSKPIRRREFDIAHRAFDSLSSHYFFSARHERQRQGPYHCSFISLLPMRELFQSIARKSFSFFAERLLFAVITNTFGKTKRAFPYLVNGRQLHRPHT